VHHNGLYQKHHNALRTKYHNRNQTTNLQQHLTKTVPNQQSNQNIDTQINATPQLHQKHHHLLQKKATKLPATQKKLQITLNYQTININNHYYKPINSFTHHLPKKFKHHNIQILTKNKHTFTIIKNMINQFIPNPTFNPIIEPKYLNLLFHKKIPNNINPTSLMKINKITCTTSIIRSTHPSQKSTTTTSTKIPITH
ncbi:MAG: hypothetical protein O7C59_00605, partial [Rickettsia endosymbiont of Ixodes persulcatus]|nr:hypothetical protein [Rickettsia endosymbiont of Ixodes persulcatus]